MFDVLPETKRLAYLEVMGVDSYFPTRQLPGAKPSVLCESLPLINELPVGAIASENVSPQTGAPQQTTGHEALRALMPHIDGIEKFSAKNPAKKSAAVAAPSAVKADTVRFNLRFFQVPGLAMIVDSSPDSAPDSPIQRLAANILLALSNLDKNWDGAIKANLRQHLFRWPVVGNAQVAQGEQAAKEAVAASVLANRERHNIPLIMLMGEQAAHYAAGDYAETRVLSAQSLSHYLINPQTKRELWHALLAQY